jgi:hypothetical protein
MAIPPIRQAITQRAHSAVATSSDRRLGAQDEQLSVAILGVHIIQFGVSGLYVCAQANQLN